MTLVAADDDRVVRLKHVAATATSSVDKKSVEGEIAVRLCNYTDVYYNASITPELPFMTATATTEQIRQFRLLPGDIVITKDSETPDDIAVPAYVDASADDLVCGYHLAIVRPDQAVIDARFLYWSLCSMRVRSHFSAEATGVTRFGLRTDAIANAPVFLPPRHIQCRVAALLDAETARIDALIEKKRRMIDLLYERFDCEIALALANGLGAPARLKESGVTWIGHIPADWTVRPVWTLFRLGRGRVISHDDIRLNPGPYPVYSSQTANDGVMGSIGTFDFDGEFLTWTTDGANAGTVFHRAGRFNCTNVCGTLSASTSLDYSFFAYALNRATSWFVRHDINPKLMNDVMASIRVPVPPLREQGEITERLNARRAAIRTMVDKHEFAINLLLERRQTLITAAVTGDLDPAEHA